MTDNHNQRKKGIIRRSVNRIANLNRLFPRIAREKIFDIKHTLKDAFIKYNLMSGGLPDFIIIGAQKCGTTSLLRNLEKHPGIFMAKRAYPELHFFDRDTCYEKGISYYKAFFTKKYMLQGEKTPEYIFLPEYHERMGKHVPDAKLILLLRNPVDRAYSQWNHYNAISSRSYRWGWTKCSFEESVTRNRTMVERGKYIEQIEHLLKLYPRQQLYIGIMEKFAENEAGEYSKLYEFLEIKIPEKTKYRISHSRIYKEEMKPETRQMLLEKFKPYNERLFEFLGYRINKWEV